MERALRARGSIAQIDMTDRAALEEMSQRTGHGMHKFMSLAEGRGDPALEAALAIRATVEQPDGAPTGRKRMSAMPVGDVAAVMPGPPRQSVASPPRQSVLQSGMGQRGSTFANVPPMVVVESGRQPVVPLPGPAEGSASLQVWNRGRESQVGGFGQERPRSQPGGQERPRSQSGSPATRNREVESSVVRRELIPAETDRSGQDQSFSSGRVQPVYQQVAATSEYGGRASPQRQNTHEERQLVERQLVAIAAGVGAAAFGQTAGSPSTGVAMRQTGQSPAVARNAESAANRQTSSPSEQARRLVHSDGGSVPMRQAGFAMGHAEVAPQATTGGVGGATSSQARAGGPSRSVTSPSAREASGFADSSISRVGDASGVQASAAGTVVHGSAPLSPMQTPTPWSAQPVNDQQGPPQDAGQQELVTRDVLPPSSDQPVERIRGGGLQKMETPTEWSVHSRHTSPSPKRVDTSGGTAPPMAAQRLMARDSSRPPSQQRAPADARSLSPSQRSVREAAEDGSSSPAGRQEEHDLPKFNTGPTIADLVAFPQGDKSVAQRGPNAAAIDEMMAMEQGVACSLGSTGERRFLTSPSTRASETATPASVKVRSSPATPLVPSSRRPFDPLPAEASTDSVLSALPAQDSTSSTVASLGLKANVKQGSTARGAQARAANVRTPASRSQARTPGTSTAALQRDQSPSSSSSLRASLHTIATTGSSSGGLQALLPAGASKASSAEFSPALGFGSQMSRSATAQATRTSSLPAPDGSSPHPRRSVTAGAQRDVSWGNTRSAGSLPLTNVSAGARGSPASPAAAKPKRRLGGGVEDPRARAELASAHSEGHLPELLPAMKPGRIQKGARTPATWLVAV